MKNTTAQERWSWRFVNVASGALLAMATVGCNCIHINLSVPQPAPAPPMVLPAPPGGSGGVFVPVQSQVKAQTSPGINTLCNPAISVQAGTYVELKPPLTQTPTAGKTGFQGYLFDVTAGATIPSSSFVLQYFVHSQLNGCCQPVGTDPYLVACPVVPPYPYRFTVYWKSTATPPPPGNVIKLLGGWTP